MCDPVSAGMFAINAVGQVGEHQAKGNAVDARNRARLSKFDRDNQDYLNEVQLDNAEYNNSVIAADIEEEAYFGAMVNQWEQYDEQLDQIFANRDFRVQEALIEMYQDDYAGTQTGATAARRAGENARKFGHKKAEETAKALLAQEESYIKKEGSRLETMSKIDQLYEKVRHPPVHGHTPIPPELEAKPSSASLVLGLASSALQAYGFSKMTKPVKTGAKPLGERFDMPKGWKSGFEAGVDTPLTSGLEIDANIGSGLDLKDLGPLQDFSTIETPWMN